MLVLSWNWGQYIPISPHIWWAETCWNYPNGSLMTFLNTSDVLTHSSFIV
jgi:hypothetical protein